MSTRGNSMLDEDFDAAGGANFSPAAIRSRISSSEVPAGVVPEAKQGKPQLFRRASAITEGMFFGAVDPSIAKRMAPTVILGLLYFKEQMDLDRVRAIAKERIFPIERFRCMPRPSADGHVRLEQRALEDMDAEHHVQLVQQDKPWGEQDLTNFLCTLNSEGSPLQDYSDPPWVMFLVQDMEGRALVVFAINHGLVDGTSAIAALMAFLDEPPTATEGQAQSRAVPLRKRAPPKLSVGNKGRAFLAGVKGGLFGTLLPGDPPNALKIKDCRHPSKQKTMGSSEFIDVGAVKRLAEKYEHCTVTDVLLGVMTVALRKYYDEVGEVPDSVRGNFPIDLRAKGLDILHQGMGNKFGNGVFRFNLKYSTLEQVVYAVKDQTDLIKNSPGVLIESWVTNKLVGFMGRTSANRNKLTDMMLDMYGGVTGMLSSNMGPQQTVFFAGQPVDDIKFFGFANIGLYFGILSYNGKVSAGVVFDHTLGEASELAKWWKPAFEDLEAAAAKHPASVPRAAKRGLVAAVDWPCLILGAGLAMLLTGYTLLGLLLAALALFVWA